MITSISGHQFDPRHVVRILELSKPDVAKNASIPSPV